MLDVQCILLAIQMLERDETPVRLEVAQELRLFLSNYKRMFEET